jgi:hypothetical protein
LASPIVRPSQVLTLLPEPKIQIMFPGFDLFSELSNTFVGASGGSAPKRLRTVSRSLLVYVLPRSRGRFFVMFSNFRIASAFDLLGTVQVVHNDKL